MRASNPKAEFKVICPEDEGKPQADQTVFWCTHLTTEEEEYLEDHLGSVTDDGFQVNLGSQSTISLSLGLARIENLTNDDNEEIELKRDETKKVLCNKKRPWKYSSLDLIPRAARKYVSTKIIESTKLSEDEQKNS